MADTSLEKLHLCSRWPSTNILDFPFSNTIFSKLPISYFIDWKFRGKLPVKSSHIKTWHPVVVKRRKMRSSGINLMPSCNWLFWYQLSGYGTLQVNIGSGHVLSAYIQFGVLHTHFGGIICHWPKMRYDFWKKMSKRKNNLVAQNTRTIQKFDFFKCQLISHRDQMAIHFGCWRPHMLKLGPSLL
jgi:hypothetical protein